MAALKINYYVGGTTMRCHDAAYILDGDDPLEQLIEAVIQTISTDIEITCGDVKMHLAAWQDPDHWSEDWLAIGIHPDDVADFVASQMVGD